MIYRVWRGRTPAVDFDRYLAYLKETGVEALRATPGNRGVQVLRRLDGEVAEFIVASRWESTDAIRAFAGSDYERAVYFPEDASYLLDMEPNCWHYEVAVDVAPITAD